ncbi:HAD-like domain-containing protein [Obelidium mucronatum]|nr:HAD-like domain-containing protein [Obelidium mucronatum]
MAHNRRKLLIVLDLNGTLIDRLAKGPERTLANRNPLCPKEPDLTLNGNKVFLRPYLDVFLQFLFDNFHVSAWTSATPKNSVPLVDFIFEPFGGAAPLDFVWDRTKCIIEPAPGKEYNSVKDLTRIWLDKSTRRNKSPSVASGEEDNVEQESEEFVNKEGIWNQHNTILVDDSASKSCRTPLNHLLIPTFSVGDLKMTRNCDEDTTLLSTVSYLKSMLESHSAATKSNPQKPWSVQEYIKTTPLYIEAGGDNALYLRNEYTVFPDQQVRAKRHRVSEDRELLGMAAFSSPVYTKKPPKFHHSSKKTNWDGVDKSDVGHGREGERVSMMDVDGTGESIEAVEAVIAGGEEIGGEKRKKHKKAKKPKSKKKRVEDSVVEDGVENNGKE